ncbi:MAG: aminoglycoside 6-N-acetyltransferase [Chloroflexota bacterium]|nr:aminoglycoside 6-N-acetyltransferase [Chloroflexota bacterium]
MIDHPHPVLVDGELGVRPSTEADLDLLAGWFSDPDVFRWWGGRPLPREDVAAKYTGRRCPRVESFIVELAGQPIGYIQYHLEGPGQAGLDMMLLPDFRGRGLGPMTARLLLAHLRAARGWTDITVDPAIDNRRAIRGWEKAGFVSERDWPDHPDGPALLMRTRQPAAPP